MVNVKLVTNGVTIESLQHNLFLKVSCVPRYEDSEEDSVILRLPNQRTVVYPLNKLILDEEFERVESYKNAVGKVLLIPVKLIHGWDCTTFRENGTMTKVIKVRLENGDIVKVELDSESLVYAKFFEVR